MTRDIDKRIKDIEIKLKKIESIKLLVPTSTTEQIIDKINEITNSIKRAR